MNDHGANEWDELYAWAAATQELSSNSESYPVGPDSLLAGDGAGMPAGVSVAAIARTMLDSAVDHLVTAIQVIRCSGQVHPAATPTLVRSAIEHAAVGMWVLTGEKRAGRQERALRVAHDSEANALRFFQGVARSSSSPPSVRLESTKAAEHHQIACDEILLTAEKLHLKRPRVKSPLQRTDMLKGIDSARGTAFLSYWQLSSGYAHGFAWAPQLFSRRLGTFEMAGGGVLNIGDLPTEKALVMLGWGRAAIQELQASFAAARADLPEHDEDATIVAS